MDLSQEMLSCLRVDVDTNGLSSCHASLTGSHKRSESPEPWGPSGSVRRRRHLGLDDEADVSSVSSLNELPSQSGVLLSQENRAASPHATSRVGTPDLMDHTRHNKADTRITGSLVPSPPFEPTLQAWRDMESLSYTTFPRFYNRLIWSNEDNDGEDLPRIMPNSRRWKFQGDGPTSRKSMERAKRQITNQLCGELDIRKARLTFTFPREDQDRFVEVHFSVYKAFAAAALVIVQWDDAPLEMVSSDAIRRTQIIITINQVAAKRAREFWLTMRKKLGPKLVFHHLWARRKEHDWTDGKQPPTDWRRKKVVEPTITLMALAEYRSGFKARDLPGYVADEHNTEFTLHFEGREMRCTVCKSKATEAHATEQCQRRRCSRCSERGHFAKDCKESSREEDDLDL